MSAEEKLAELSLDDEAKTESKQRADGRVVDPLVAPALEAELAFEIIQKLELAFSDPAFTGALGDFLRSSSSSFEPCSISEEQPLANHDLYCKFVSLVESLLEDHLQKHNLTNNDLVAAIETMQSAGRDSSSFLCVDYVLGMSSYPHFHNLMLDMATLASGTFFKADSSGEVWTPDRCELDDEGIEEVELESIEHMGRASC